MQQLELDREEKVLLASFEAGEWQSVENLAAEIERFEQLAQNQDSVLWSFVEREQTYQAAHPEGVIVCDSNDALLAALDAETCDPLDLAVTPPD